MIVRFLVNAAALALATWVVPGISVLGLNKVNQAVAVLVVAAIFGLLNSAVKPLFNFVAAPWKLILLGLALWIVNALLLMGTSWVCAALGVPWRVFSFNSALMGAAIVAVVSFVLNSLIGTKQNVHP